MTITFKNGDKITASKDVFNELSLIYDMASDERKSKGYNAIAKEYEEKASLIYSELNKIGFYESVH